MNKNFKELAKAMAFTAVTTAIIVGMAWATSRPFTAESGPVKRPEEIISDDHPNRRDSDGMADPAPTDNGQDDPWAYVQPSDPWDVGPQDDSWVYPDTPTPALDPPTPTLDPPTSTLDAPTPTPVRDSLGDEAPWDMEDKAPWDMEGNVPWPVVEDELSCRCGCGCCYRQPVSGYVDPAAF